jgi:hypothetical protein
MIGTNLAISAQGLIGSKRNKKDGCTIIGSLQQNSKTQEYINDFVIPNVPINDEKQPELMKSPAGAGIG